jgi:parvulin-like peptidyl-prolyl isomerase
MKTVFVVLSLIAGLPLHAQVLATVGESKITAEDFTRKLDEVRKQATNPPTPAQFLEDLVRFEVGVQEAEKLKLQNDPLVKERFKQVLYNGLLEKQIGKRIEDIKITEAELRESYKKHPELRIAQILFDVKPNATPQEREIVKKRAMMNYDDVRKSKRPFEELVRLYSDDTQTKDTGGDIGFQTHITLVPALYDPAAQMKVGEVKGLIESRFGYHIIKLLDRRAFDLADKRQIRAGLFDEKRAKIFNEYFEKLKKQYPIAINHEALKSLNH